MKFLNIKSWFPVSIQLPQEEMYLFRAVQEVGGGYLIGGVLEIA